MKKKMLFMVINMNVGGTEKALLNMIAELPKDKYDITILMLEEYGGFLSSIPDEVHIKYVKGYKNMKAMLNKPPKEIILDFIKKGKIIKAFNMVFLHLISKVMKERSIFFKYLLNDYPVIDNEYDVAVAYAGPMDFISYFVLNKVRAKKKVQWIHFDVTKIGFNQNFASKIYSKFDKIFVVSNEAKNKLTNKVPALKGKTEVFFNLVSPQMIHDQVKESNGFNDKFAGLRILTVGRLTTEKGQDLAIRVLGRLINEGYKVKWYCVGEGNARGEYEKLVEEYNLRDKFIFLGADPNPYPYIDQCDIYVQPSRYEGYCITLIEARCLNKPIITTDVNGAKEQIKNMETGLIVNIDENEIYTAVVNLIKNQDLRNKFSANLAKEHFDNTHEMQKIYNPF